MATLISTNVTGTLDILNSSSNIKLLRLSHPTSPTTAGGFLGFNSDGTTNNMVVTLGVQYSSNYYNVINIKRDTRNVGIGIASPAATLHIKEIDTDEDAILKISPNNGSYDPVLQFTPQDGTLDNEGFEIWYDNNVGDAHIHTIYNNDAAAIRFHTRTGASKSTSNERLTIAGDGNVGIGTTVPSKKLDVNGDVKIAGDTLNAGFLQAYGSNFNVGNNNYGVFIGTYSGGTSISPGEVILSTQGKTGWGVDDGLGRIRFFLGDSSGVGARDVAKIEAVSDAGNGSTSTTASGALAFHTSPYNSQVSERVRIAGDGKVGIGTTDPAEKLHVTETIRAGSAGNSSANLPALRVYASGTNPEQSSIAIQQGTTEGDTIIFADYEPYVEYGINTDNGNNTIEFTAGTSTNNLGSKTLYNNSGSARTAYKKVIISLTSGNMSVGGNVGIGITNPNTYKLEVAGPIYSSNYYATNTSSSYQKLSVYGSGGTYGIGMVAGITYGALNDWAMTFRFNSENDRGFWWGDTSHSTAQGAMSLTTNGYLTVANRVKVGGGETDTSGPSYLLHVEGGSGAAGIPVAWIHNSGNATGYDGTVISTVNDGADAEVLHVRTNNTTYNNGTSLMLVRGDGHVGIGTNSPNDKLEIYGNMRVRGSDGFGANSTANYNPSYVAFPGGGKIGSSSTTVTGYIKITLPQSWTNTMMQFSVDIFEYQVNKAKTFVLAGYNYAPSSSWHNASAMVLAADDGTTYKVQFGHDGSKCAIYISKGTDGASTSWSYPYVVVRDASFGFTSTGISNWIDGWNVSFSTATLSGITQTRDISTQITGTGTSQYITKWNSTGTEINDSVIVQNVSNIGIGIANAQRLVTLYKASTPVLQLVNSTTGTGNSDGFLLTQTGLNTVIENSEAGYMAFRTTADEKMRIDASGNVGIGIASPSAGLHVLNSTEPTVLFESTNAGSSGSRLQLYHNSATPADNDIISNIQMAGEDSSGAKRYAALIQTRAADVNASSVDGDIRFLTYKSDTPSEVMRITHDKTVLIEDGSVGAPALSFINDTNTGMWRPGSDQLRLATGGTDAIIIDSSQNVTIGNGGNGGGATITPGGQTSVYALRVDRSGSSGTSVDIWDYNSNSVIIGATSSEKTLIVKAGGNVGIGTTDPSQALTVAGKIDAKNAMGVAGQWSSSQIRLETTNTVDTTGWHGISFDASTTDNYGWSIGVNRSGSGRGSFRFYEHVNSATGTERFTIEQDGNVGIGTPSPDSGLTIAKAQTSAHTYTTNHLHLATPTTSNNGGATTISFATSTVDNYGWSLAAIRETTDGADTRFAFKSHVNSDSGNERLSILADGNVGIGTANPSAKLHVVGSTSGDSALKIDGTNGTLFEVVDDLSDSLMSVNDAAGLPVFEVFADNTIVGGRYNKNDFYLQGSSGKIGMGTDAPHATALTIQDSAGDVFSGVNGVFALKNYAGVVTHRFSSQYVPSAGSQAYATYWLYNPVNSSVAFYVRADNSLGPRLQLNNSSGSNSIYLSTYAGIPTAFNVGQENIDFNVRGDSDINLFYADASTDRIGIGTNTNINTKLLVEGDATVNGDLSAGGSAAANRTLTLNSVAQAGRPAAKINNPNLDTATASDGRTFHGWLPIDLDGTVKYIPVYN